MATARRQACRRGVSVVRPPPSPAFPAKPSYLPLPSSVCAPASRRGRLAIAYQITDDQLQVAIEVACQTDRMQVLTIIGWADCIDGVSRRLLTDALRAAARPDNPVRLQVFAPAARDLFRHTCETLTPCPAHHGLSKRISTETGAPHGDLLSSSKGLAAIDHLRNDARLRPRVTVTDRAATRLVNEALSALQELYALFGDYLEQALQPLEPLIGRDAIHAFVLETRAEVDELAACHAAGNVYVESLTITEPGDNAISLEVEATFKADQRP